MQVSILGLAFECKLIPKGNRKYLIHIAKKTLSPLAPEEEYEIEWNLLYVKGCLYQRWLMPIAAVLHSE